MTQCFLFNFLFFIDLFIQTHRPQKVSVWAGTDHHSGGLVELIRPSSWSPIGAVGRVRPQRGWMCTWILEIQYMNSLLFPVDNWSQSFLTCREGGLWIFGCNIIHSKHSFYTLTWQQLQFITFHHSNTLHFHKDVSVVCFQFRHILFVIFDIATEMCIGLWSQNQKVKRLLQFELKLYHIS